MSNNDMPERIWLDVVEDNQHLTRKLMDVYLYERGTEYIRADLVQPAGGCNGDPSRNGCEHCEPEHGCKPQPAFDVAKVREALEAAVTEPYFQQLTLTKVKQALAELDAAQVAPNAGLPKTDMSNHAYDTSDYIVMPEKYTRHRELPHIKGLQEAVEDLNSSGMALARSETLKCVELTAREYLKRMKPEAGE